MGETQNWVIMIADFNLCLFVFGQAGPKSQRFEAAATLGGNIEKPWDIPLYLY